MLVVSGGRLFCNACREELSTKRSVIVSHIKSEKHANGKAKLTEKSVHEKDIAKALIKYNEEVHLEGETLPVEQQVYRVKVVRAFLRAGVPLHKITSFRGILEENALRLTDRSHMSNFIPFILKEEQKLLCKEIENKHISVTFDGTTRHGEAMVIVVRFVSNEWELEQRLLQFHILSKCMTGEEIARELITALSTKFGISSDLLLACMRDRASVNNVAVRFLSMMYPSLIDVPCFSHTLNLVGEHFKVPTVSEFVSSWVSLFAHSAKAKLVWKDRVGSAVLSYSHTRWWSQWEVLHQVMVCFGDVEPFLDDIDTAPATTAKLRKILATKKDEFRVELAALIDAGKYFVETTYQLESDGPTVLCCYEIIDRVLNSIKTGHYPNLEAVCRSISAGDKDLRETWFKYGMDCIEPGLTYFADTIIDGPLKPALAIFKAARLFNPQKIAEMSVTAESLDALQVVPFFDSEMIGNLKEELPSYLSKATDLSPDHNPLVFWRSHSPNLSHWAAAAKKILVVQPSSAASERAFSLLTSTFHDQQSQSLVDYIELSMMLQFNGR